MTAPTKAAARRWLVAHEGQVLDTVQHGNEPGQVWEPGPRTLRHRGASSWDLAWPSGRVSSLVITPEHQVVAVTDDRLVLAWLTEDGIVIHTTTYTSGGAA